MYTPSYSFVHLFIHVHTHSFIHSFMYTPSNSFIYSFTDTPIHSFIHIFIHVHTHLFSHSSIHSWTHPVIHSFIHSCTHPFIHSFIHSLKCSFMLYTVQIHHNIHRHNASTGVGKPAQKKKPHKLSSQKSDHFFVNELKQISSWKDQLIITLIITPSNWSVWLYVPSAWEENRILWAARYMQSWPLTLHKKPLATR